MGSIESQKTEIDQSFMRCVNVSGSAVLGHKK